MTPFELGYNAALEKIAVKIPIKIPSRPTGWWATRGAPALKNLGITLKEMAVGSPTKAYKQMREGTLFAPSVRNAKGEIITPSGLGRFGLEAPGVFNKILMYGLPAASAIQTIRGNSPTKIEDLGALAAGTLAGGAAFGPLGMLGSVPITMLAETGARRLIHGGKKLLGVGNPAPSTYNSSMFPAINTQNEGRGTINPAQQWRR